MQCIYYGQSSFQVTISGKKIFFDPFITANPLAQDIDISTIEANYIFVSHGHGDHVADPLTMARNTNALVVANFEITNWVQAHGYTQVHSMNFGTIDQATITYDFIKYNNEIGLHYDNFDYIKINKGEAKIQFNKKNDKTLKS